MDGADRQKKKDLVERLSDLAERTPSAQNPQVQVPQKDSPFVKHVQTNENLLSKSTVITENEASAERLEQIRAYRAQMDANSIREAKKIQAQRRAVKILVITLLSILGIALIWLIIEAILIARQPVAPAIKDDPEIANVTEIGNYKCKTKLCSKLVDLPDGQIILRDTVYYIYDSETQEAKVTAIEEKSYREASTFFWGDHLMLVLAPVTGDYGLFSVTDNRSISKFNYDSFISDEKDTAYASMEWVVGKYIIAKKGNNYHFLDINTSKDLFHANKKVFIHDKFCFAYDKKGDVRSYTLEGRKIATFKVVDDFFIRQDHLIIIPKGDSEENRTEMRLYDHTGASVSEDNPYYDGLIQSILEESENYAITLQQRRDTYTVPKF